MMKLECKLTEKVNDEKNGENNRDKYDHSV